MPQMIISIDLRGKSAVVVGGGRVAARKCLTLVRSEALVTVISPELSPALRRISACVRISHIAKDYSEGDLKGASLVFAATDRPETNRAVADEAFMLGIPVNVCDSPELGSFSSPAVLRRGDLSIALATGGKSPALSRRIRKQLAATYGREYALTVSLLGKIREKLLTRKDNRRYNNQILSTLANSHLPELFKKGLLSDIDHLLLELCGPGFSSAELGLRNEARL
jgi:precorrin-2 dehydrogenase/sirohydrochlorin ferrochelatase